jgi:hypothetical protein
VKLASRGQRDMDNGAEAIVSQSALHQIRHQARGVHAKALATAAVLTIVALVA